MLSPLYLLGVVRRRDTRCAPGGVFGGVARELFFIFAVWRVAPGGAFGAPGCRVCTDVGPRVDLSAWVLGTVAAVGTVWGTFLSRQPRGVSAGRLGHGREDGLQVRTGRRLPVSEPLPENGTTLRTLPADCGLGGRASRPLGTVTARGARWAGTLL